MRRFFSDLLLALQGIAQAINLIAEALHALPTIMSTPDELAGRVASLELELERRHAEAEGLLLRAQGKYDAARAAEERARRLGRATDGDDEGDEDGFDPEELALWQGQGVRPGDAPGGPESGMRALHGPVGRGGKTHALNAKYGRG